MARNGRSEAAAKQRTIEAVVELVVVNSLTVPAHAGVLDGRLDITYMDHIRGVGLGDRGTFRGTSTAEVQKLGILVAKRGGDIFRV